MKKSFILLSQAFVAGLLVIACGRSTTTDLPNSPSTFSSGGGSSTTLPSTFSGGSGTSGDPYRISTVTDLKALDQHSELWSKSFILTKNIDLSSSEFNPFIDGFSGTFDGNSYTLSGFSSSYPLFVALSGTVKNLTLTNATVVFQGNSRAALLVGTITSTGTVSSCRVEGTVTTFKTGVYFVASLAARNLGTIQYSSASATVVGGTGVGGLTAFNSGHIYNSYFTGNVTATASGMDSDAQYGIGGIAGYSSGDIRDCYYTSGTLTADRLSGGIVGYNNGSILRAYASNLFSNNAASNLGGVVGYASAAATTTSSYWDSQVSGVGSSAGGSSQTTSTMHDSSTFSGWNFSLNWYFPNSSSYPKLLGVL